MKSDIKSPMQFYIEFAIPFHGIHCVIRSAVSQRQNKTITAAHCSYKQHLTRNNASYARRES